jgi:hypothetical protein
MVNRQRTARRVAGAVLIVTALVSGFHWSPRLAEAAADTQVAEVLFADHEQAACRARARDFDVDRVREVYACLVFPGLQGTHYAQLTFVSPDGNVYQTMTVPFATLDAPPAKSTVLVAGRHHTVKRAGQRGHGEAVITATLPVAGTHITQHNLVGLWTVKVSLNGRPVDWGEFYLHRRR